MKGRICCLLMLVAVVLIGFIPVSEGDGVIIPSPEFYWYPEIEYHNVTVTINEWFAITEVDQRFHNPYNRTLNGTYVFPVPEGASISKFIMTINGVEHTAEVMNEEQARDFFKEIVSSGGDTSLLEYVDRTLFRYRVSIPAGESRRICLEYEELLPFHGSMYRYTYTLGTERYSSSLIEYVSVVVNITSTEGIESVYSPTHDVVTSRSGANTVTVFYEARYARPDKDISIYYTLSDDPFGGGLLHYVQDGEGFFLFTFAPNPDEFEETAMPKDIVFVIDESGSMSGEKVEQAKEALKLIIGQLGPDDRFSIVNFSSGANIYSSSLVDVNYTNIADAVRYVDAIDAGGGTDIREALLAAIGIFDNSSDSEALKVIVHLTDGRTSNEDDLPADVRQANENTGVDASIYNIGVGYSVNTVLLDKLSEQNHGSTLYVEPGESIETVLTRFYGQISSPLFTDVTIEFDGMEVYDLYPEKVPDVFRGSQIVLVGRYTGSGDVAVELSGTTSEGETTFSFEFDHASSSMHDFVPRIWATRKIGHLLNRIRFENETEELVDEVKGLGLKYGIVTPYTSMLIDAGSNSYGMNSTDGLYADSGYNSVKLSAGTRAYSYASVADTGTGGNIVVAGTKTFVNVNGTFIDMALLSNMTVIDIANKTESEWVEENLDVTVNVTFGSDEYFDLVDNWELVDVLPIGEELVFAYQNETIYISDRNWTETGTVPEPPMQPIEPTTPPQQLPPDPPFETPPETPPVGGPSAEPSTGPSSSEESQSDSAHQQEAEVLVVGSVMWALATVTTALVMIYSKRSRKNTR